MVLLISLDGFANNYLGKAYTPTLDSLTKYGVKADALIPVFPSKTFPNHYTQVTGLYPGRHGIISNRMYDPQFKQYFNIGSASTSVRDGRWFDGEPIWVTASKQGLISATMFWPGSEAEINGFRPDYFFAYNSSIPESDRILQVLEWMALDKHRPHFISLYFEDIDHAGHLHGPNARAVFTTIELIDRQLNQLAKGITSLKLDEVVNLIIVSDHGMAAQSRERVIFLDDYISLQDIEVVNWSPVLELIPEFGKQELVYEQLSTAHPKLSVYQNGIFPESWHLNGHRRATPIIGLAAPGWSISSRTYFEEHLQAYTGGAHGYHPGEPDMQGIFIACGPAFKTGSRIGSLESVHLYQLLCNVLGLIPAQNDGIQEVWADILVKY
ncbi:MAG: alkaline phosphatase family protein [Cyclobacteriaceae bacterium]|nr:MAG: alkaline phosphatase family protein [Cyclobacteriaceae bacterium]